MKALYVIGEIFGINLKGSSIIIFIIIIIILQKEETKKRLFK